MNQQIVAQQQQIQHLSDRYAQLTVDHQLMLQEVMRVQKTVLNHESVIHQVMNFLHSVDARQRRDTKSAATPFPAQQGQPAAAGAGGGSAGSTMSPSQVTPMEDEPSSPLQQASKLLNDMQSEMQFNLTGVDSMGGGAGGAGGDPSKASGVVSTPSMDAAARNGVVRPPTGTNANPAALVYPTATPKINGEMDSVVYPVGATNGIDPMYNEHVPHIPYPIPAKPEQLESNDAARRQFPDNRKKSTNVDPGWMRSPHILLVEDDATCRQIGGKFLYSFSCVIDTAVCPPTPLFGWKKKVC